MYNDATMEQVKILAKQLKIPTFVQYPDLLRQAGADTDFGSLLLTLMRNEYDQRQENQNRRRLKQAGLPYMKTLEELDLSRYDGKISELFIGELASCRFIREKKNIIMLGNPGRGKTHMAIGLALKACSLGMNVLFKNDASLGYTGALKAPVRCFGNHLSRKRKSLFRTDDECGGAAILKKMLFRMGRQLIGYYYSLNAGSSPYTSLMER